MTYLITCVTYVISYDNLWSSVSAFDLREQEMASMDKEANTAPEIDERHLYTRQAWRSFSPAASRIWCQRIFWFHFLFVGCWCCCNPAARSLWTFAGQSPWWAHEWPTLADAREVRSLLQHRNITMMDVSGCSRNLKRNITWHESRSWLSNGVAQPVTYHHLVAGASNSYLIGGLEHFFFLHILGLSSSQLTFIFFQRGLVNHQPYS